MMDTKELRKEEEAELRAWVRENFNPSQPMCQSWSAVVRDEWLKCLDEAVKEAIKREIVETPLGEQIDGGGELDDCSEYEDYSSQFDDDPSVYEGTYSED